VAPRPNCCWPRGRLPFVLTQSASPAVTTAAGGRGLAAAAAGGAAGPGRTLSEPAGHGAERMTAKSDILSWEAGVCMRPSDEPGAKLTVKAVEHSSLALPPWCKISQGTEPTPAAPKMTSVLRLSDAGLPRRSGQISESAEPFPAHLMSSTRLSDQGLPRREDVVAPLPEQRVLRSKEPALWWSNVLSWEADQAISSSSLAAGRVPPSAKPPVGFIPIQPAQHVPLPLPPWRSTPAASSEVPRNYTMGLSARVSEGGQPARGRWATTDSAALAVGSPTSSPAASACKARADAATSWETEGTTRPSDQPGAINLYRPPPLTPLPRCATGGALRFVPWARGIDIEGRRS
jgi:hypothetical protein